MNDIEYVSLSDIVLDENRRAMIELLPVGEWIHPSAPKGKFTVTETLLDEFIANFKNRVVGKELPIDFRHEGESGNGVPFVGGWIIDMIKKVDEMGRKAIYAILHVTDGEAAKRIKEKSLKYISPSIKLKFQNPEDGKLYNIIRAASLTNWPYIKNMSPVSPINFEEIKEVNDMSDNKDRFKELSEKETLSFEEFEEYRTLLNDDPELDEQEVNFKLKEAYDKLSKKEEKKEEKKIENTDDKADKPESPDNSKDDKGGDVNMSEELKPKVEELQKQIEMADKKLEESSAKHFALQEKIRSQEIDAKVQPMISSGRITPAMGKIAKTILMAGDAAKAKVTIELSDGKTEEAETNVAELFLQFVESMPKEWKIEMEQKGKKGVVIEDKLELSEEDIKNMPPEEYEKHRKAIFAKMNNEIRPE